jgi:hypothetical protein
MCREPRPRSNVEDAPSTTINQGNATGLRLGGYFALFIGVICGVVILRTVHREYVAQRWPLASGEIIAAEEKSRTLSHSTDYWAEYTVRLNLTHEQCRTEGRVDQYRSGRHGVRGNVQYI